MIKFSPFKAGLTGLIILGLLLAGCGFKLRGSGPALAWPDQLVTLQLRFDSSVNPDFRRLLRQRLVGGFAVKIVKQGAPELAISAVILDRRVLSLNATGKVSEYLLRLQVSFELHGNDGKSIIEKQTVRLQRDFSFSRLDILAQEVEQASLSEQMQNDAVRRILRRVIALTKSS